MSSDPETPHPETPAKPPASHPVSPLLAAPLHAAAWVVLVARWLPLPVAWQPNDQGIVSATILAHYPTQQETIWYALCVALGIALVWSGASALARRTFEGPAAVAFEGLALGALLCALALPRGIATAAVSALALCAVAWLRRQPAAVAAPGTPRSAAVRSAVPSVSRSVSRSPSDWPGGPWRFAVVLLGLALLRTPTLWVALRWMAAGQPDLALARHDWLFQVEIGQHLAWADALWNGGLHGRDFFCLYGPLYDWGVVGIWSLFSRSIRGWYLYAGLADWLGLLCLLALASALVRRRIWVLAILPLFVYVNLRLGLPLLALFLLARGLSAAGSSRGAGVRWLFASGAVGGLALLYSQEFALAFVCAAAPVLVVRRSLAGGVAFAAGIAAAVVPWAATYAAAGALVPLVSDLARYPGWVMAGFGNLPFPGVSRWLPLGWPLPSDDGALTFRLGWLCGAAPVALLGMALPRISLRGRSPMAWLRDALDGLRRDPERLALIATGIFGVLAFRSVLGRSDLFHVQAVVPVTALALVVAADRITAGARVDPVAAAVAAGRILLLACVAWLGGVATHVVPASVAYTGLSVGQAVQALRGTEPPGRVNPRLRQAVDWIRAHSDEDDPVFFVPNDAAWYYLVGRPNPTRFAVTHQMVTDAHRAEALADLRARPPRFVVWDDRALRIDGVPDEAVMGEAMLAWIDDHYEPVRRFGPLRVLAPRAGEGAGSESGEPDP